MVDRRESANLLIQLTDFGVLINLAVIVTGERVSRTVSAVARVGSSACWTPAGVTVPDAAASNEMRLSG